MSKINVIRTDCDIPDERALEGARSFLFNALSGFNRQDKISWNRLWKRMLRLEPGEIMLFEASFPRSGPFHRRHMKIEQSVFDAQERLAPFGAFRDWLKIGSGHCKWLPGPKGGIVPIPDSTSYTAMDDEEFKRFHENSITFLRTDHAQRVLWPHLDQNQRREMIEAILEGFLE